MTSRVRSSRGAVPSQKRWREVKMAWIWVGGSEVSLEFGRSKFDAVTVLRLGDARR